MSKQTNQPTRDILVFLPIGVLIILGALLRIFLYEMTIPYPWTAFIIALIAGGAGGVLLARWSFYKSLRLAWWLYGAFLLLAVIAPWLGLQGKLGALTAALNPSFTLAYLWLLFPIIYGLLLYRMRGTGFLGLLLCCLLFAVPFLCGTWVFYREMLCVCVGSFGCFAVLIAAIAQDYFGCNRYAALAFVALGAAAAILLFCIVEPYRLQRILSLLHPETDTLGQNWSMLRLREILGSCRFIGQGRALPYHTEQWMLHASNGSVQKDFFLAFLLYRYGCIVAIPPIACMAAFLALAARRTRRLSNTLGRTLSRGVLTVFAAQTAFSLLTNLGFPLWVSALFPFLSYGNTAFLTNLLLCAVLLSLFLHDADFTDTPYRQRRLRVRFEVKRAKGDI